MGVPDFQNMMLPFLKIASDGKEHTFGGIANVLADAYKLTGAERVEMVPSGRQTRLMNRVYWISTHFKNAKLIEASRRGAFKILPRGLELIQKEPNTYRSQTTSYVSPNTSHLETKRTKKSPLPLTIPSS